MSVLIFILLCTIAFAIPIDTIVFEDVELQNSVSITQITCIEHDQDGRLWISSFEGLFMYDGYNFKKFQANEYDGEGLVKNEVFRIHRSQEGDIWFAGPVSIYRYNKYTDRLERMTESKRKSFDELYTIGYFDMEDVDQDHKILCTKQGYWIYHVPTQSMVRYDSLVQELEIDPYSSNAHIVQIEPDDKDENLCWMLTRDGLYSFDKKTWNSTKVSKPSYVPFDKLRNRGHSLVVQGDYIYVLVNFLEVHAYHKVSGKWTVVQKYGEGKKLYIRNLVPFENGILIIYIENGIEFYDPVVQKLERITLENQDIAGVNSLSYMGIDHTGRFTYIYNIQKLVKSKKSYYPKQTTQQLFTKNLKIEDQRYTRDSSSTEILKLKAYQRNVSFDIGITNREYGVEEKFFYKVNQDDSWRLMQDNSLILEGLSSGNHEIFARAKFGNKIIESSVKRIYIKPHFYETWWFYGIICIMTLAIIGVIIALVYLRKLDKRKYELQLVELEMDALRSQMNPHFIFNSLSSIKNYVVTKSKDEAADYLTKFARLIRMILENSKKNFLSLEDELKMLELYIQMEQRRLNYSFDYEISLPEDKRLDYSIAPMLIQPFIENSIWHGLVHREGKRLLKLIIDPQKDMLVISILDNGIGREASRSMQQDSSINKKSLGLKITESRFESIKKAYNINARLEVIDLKDSSNKAIGTEVKIFFPYIDKYNKA